MRIGYGYDVHAFEKGRPLILGGVEVPFDRGFKGHSDADVLTHAVADALLGAVAMGDIGAHFPDTDVRWKDADSLELLREIKDMVEKAGHRVGNVDATVILERPTLRPYIDSMRRHLAEALAVEAERVSVKATTSEAMGFVGEGRGAAAHAVCLVVPLSP